MIELIQIPWSPYCLVQRRILEFAGVPHKVTNIPPNDRSLVWRLSRGRYYAVPLLRDGRTVVFETDDHSQVIAKYLETKLKLGLFPPQWDGLQRILWRYLEDDIEAVTFKLNDIYFREFVPKAEQLAYLRHKERKFGRGCVDQWGAGQRALVAQLTDLLLPLEQMLGTRRFLLDDRPRFVDFDLWGMLANFLYSGHYRIPATRPRLRAWHRRMSLLQVTDCPQ
ncbi:MAG: hypothetical protein RJA22_553 [Verrucomicrobiota bacterium]|jgi:glutathione S-transferase